MAADEIASGVEDKADTSVERKESVADKATDWNGKDRNAIRGRRRDVARSCADAEDADDNCDRDADVRATMAIPPNAGSDRRRRRHRRRHNPANFLSPSTSPRSGKR